MIPCGKCGNQRETRHLKDGLCAVCSKSKARTVVDVPIPRLLTANALKQLPQRREVGPDDSFSVIGNKR